MIDINQVSGNGKSTLTCDGAQLFGQDSFFRLGGLQKYNFML